MNGEVEDRLFSARLNDIVNRCERDGVCCFSNFLDERQCVEAERWCRYNTGGLKYMLYGGFPEAQRRMLAVFPDYYEDYIIEEFPLECLTFKFRKEDKLTHRDFLGSFMGMRLKREVMGDIIVNEGIAQVFVTEIAAKLILSTVSKIGSTGVKVCDDVPFQLEVKQEFRNISGTVASLRLDCVVSLAAGIGRENAARLIRSDKTEVNHFPVTSVSHELKEGDMLSVRGCGRFVLSGINGTTKKGRIHIILKKYI